MSEFIRHRTPGTSERFDYRVIPLQATANQTLIHTKAGGYRIITLRNDLVVLERQ